MDTVAAKIAFNDSLELGARLAAFATARFQNPSGHSTMESVAEELAHRDTLNIALTLRRLSEIASLQTELKNISLSQVRPAIEKEKVVFLPTAEVISLHSLIGILIHSLTFALYKNSGKVRVHLGQGKNDTFETYNLLKDGEQINAICLVQSDKSSRILFPVDKFVIAAIEFLDAAQRKLSDDGVYVGLFDFD